MLVSIVKGPKTIRLNNNSWDFFQRLKHRRFVTALVQGIQNVMATRRYTAKVGEQPLFGWLVFLEFQHVAIKSLISIFAWVPSHCSGNCTDLNRFTIIRPNFDFEYKIKNETNLDNEDAPYKLLS